MNYLNNKKDYFDELHKSKTYNSMGKNGKKILDDVVNLVSDVTETIDERKNKNPYSSTKRTNHPYENGQKPNTQPKSNVNNYETSQNYSAPAPKKKEKTKKKKKYKYKGLMALIIVASFLVPAEMLFSYTNLSALLVIFSSIGIGVSSCYLTAWAFKIREKKELPKPKEAPVIEQAVKSSTGNKELDKVVNDGHDYIIKLKKANDAIPNETLTEYIDRMENASFDIFAYVSDNPEKIPQIKRFMNYYLPTTLELLEKYQTMQAQSVKGENIKNALSEIERMMYTIANAFEKQLDLLFSQETIDIGVDISVFDSILEQEGLKKDKDNIGG